MVETSSLLPALLVIWLKTVQVLCDESNFSISVSPPVQSSEIRQLYYKILTKQVDHVVHVGGSQSIPGPGQGSHFSPSPVSEDFSWFRGLIPRKAARHQVCLKYYGLKGVKNYISLLNTFLFPSLNIAQAWYCLPTLRSARFLFQPDMENTVTSFLFPKPPVMTTSSPSLMAQA